MELKDSMTSILIPFNYDNYKIIESSINKSKWEKCSLKIDKGAIYSHIQNFLIDNINGHEKPILNKCVIFSLKDSWEHLCPEERSVQKLFKGFRNEISVNQDGVNRLLTFSIINEKSNLSSPKLILYPQALVGFLIISIELNSNNYTVKNLVSLNYSIAKIDYTQAPSLSIINNHPNNKRDINNIYITLSNYFSNDTNVSAWHFGGLINFLLSDFNANNTNIKLFNETRAHLFTYIQIQSEQLTDELLSTFIRILRCQNEKYLLSNYDLDIGKQYEQLFKNIYIGSAVEGAAIMTIVNNETSSHVNNFKTGTFIPRYLWIYLLVFIQRLSILALVKELIKINLETAVNSKNNLLKIISSLSKMKINAHFTDISDHTQHNLFYNFCSNNLKVIELLNEASAKIRDIEIIMNEQLGELEKIKSNRWEKFLASMMFPPVLFSFLSLLNFKFILNPNDLSKLFISLIILIISIYLFYKIAQFMFQSNK